jgi:hypothetical protein
VGVVYLLPGWSGSLLPVQGSAGSVARGQRLLPQFGQTSIVRVSNL